MKWDTTSQSLAWFKDRALDDSLSLAESYQRKPVWKLRERCALIESVLLECPIPEIYIHTTVDSKGKSTFAVVDGQQRVRSVLKFLGMDRDAEDNGFALECLDEDSPYFSLKFEALGDDTKESFYDYRFAVRTLKTKDLREIRDMFVRLNKFQMPLKGQEVRNAQFQGPLVRLAVVLADNPFFAKHGIVTAATIRRMGDIEFVSELIVGSIYGPQDGSRSRLDDLYQEFEQYKTEIPGQAQVRARFEEVLTTIEGIIPNLFDTRWSNKHDFYSLFLAISALLKQGHKFDSLKKGRTAEVLLTFAADANKYIENESAKIPKHAKQYANAVQKGPSSKARRAIRHQELLNLLTPFFKKVVL